MLSSSIASSLSSVSLSLSQKDIVIVTVNMNDNGVNAEKVSSSSSSSGNNDDSGLSNELSSMTIDSSCNSSKKKKKNTCLFCLKVVVGCSRCSRCETALYCDRECQVKHWPMHKNSCMNSSDTEDSNEKLDMKALNHIKQGNCIHIYQRLSSLPILLS